ncbi:hypothetical protein [Nocardia australiensis]|uniref:hypothetical protein n=1 Tax=Nocardia australiensis TaxID=2887191 RepID=UPI0027DECE50|nr:hypothetical protein [Nocardia australiensis]
MFRPNRPDIPGPGQTGSRQAVPMPGRHLPGAHGRQEPADPARIRADVDSLLAELDTRTGVPENTESGADITRRARILEQAHEVLVQALATVDKI